MKGGTYERWNTWKVEHMKCGAYERWNILKVEHMKGETYERWNIWKVEHMKGKTYERWNSWKVERERWNMKRGKIGPITSTLCWCQKTSINRPDLWAYPKVLSYLTGVSGRGRTKDSKSRCAVDVVTLPKISTSRKVRRAPYTWIKLEGFTP